MDRSRIPQPAPDGIARFSGVSKQFSSGNRVVAALRQINLTIKKGRITGLIGPDGAGKTTLMRLTVGLLAPNQGQITVLGLDAVGEPLSVQARVSYMPQRFGLYEDLTVQQNLDLYSDLQGVPHSARPARYLELMRMTGLARFTSRLAGRLSGGMKQKLGLACTLVRSPQLLLLDEPTVGVDPLSRRELWQIVGRLVREEGVTVLLSTAYLDEAERCQDIVLMHAGEVLGQGPPDQFRRQLEGRTYTLAAPGLRKRAVQTALAAAPSVLDAVIQGDRVRLVMKTETAPNADLLLPESRGITLQPTPPRLEDSFIALLKQKQPSHSSAAVSSGPLPALEPRRTDAEPIIAVKNVKRRFGQFYAVKDISFHVQRGEVFGLLGANGAGKSTTFRMLCGLLPATEGTLRVAGVDLRRAAAAARARIGYMSQKFSLYGQLTVCENLRFFSSAYGLRGRRQHQRLEWALEQFDLDAFRDAASQDLPLGHKQRLAMACALMHQPEILFLDEPTSGVDPLARREFWSRISALAEGGTTVLVTTHFMEEAEYCDRLAIMAEGQILAMGAPDEVRRGQRSASVPNPTLEEAFISLIEHPPTGRHAEAPIQDPGAQR